MKYKLSLRKSLRKYKGLYLMLILPLAWYLVFCYFPMFGVVIGFQDYHPGDSVWSAIPFCCPSGESSWDSRRRLSWR